jgi:parallel beta-helix repeat protein
MTRRLKPASSKCVDEIEKSVFSGNVTIGLRVSGGPGNKIEGNTANNNGFGGITIQANRTSNEVEENTANGNNQFGIFAVRVVSSLIPSGVHVFDRDVRIWDQVRRPIYRLR